MYRLQRTFSDPLQSLRLQKPDVSHSLLKRRLQILNGRLQKEKLRQSELSLQL